MAHPPCTPRARTHPHTAPRAPSSRCEGQVHSMLERREGGGWRQPGRARCRECGGARVHAARWPTSREHGKHAGTCAGARAHARSPACLHATPTHLEQCVQPPIHGLRAGRLQAVDQGSHQLRPGRQAAGGHHGADACARSVAQRLERVGQHEQQHVLQGGGACKVRLRATQSPFSPLPTPNMQHARTQLCTRTLARMCVCVLCFVQTRTHTQIYKHIYRSAPIS